MCCVGTAFIATYLDISMLQILNNRRSGMLLIVKTVMTKKVLIDDMAIDHLEFLTNTR